MNGKALYRELGFKEGMTPTVCTHVGGVGGDGGVGAGGGAPGGYGGATL